MVVPVPALIPVIFPVDVFIDALALLQLHVPPVVASVNNTVMPTHSDDDPCTGVGAILTVTNWVVLQLPMVYEMVAEPVVLTVTNPDVPIVATKPSLLLQVPPAVRSLRDVVLPLQTDGVPSMEVIVPTVTVVVLVQPEVSE